MLVNDIVPAGTVCMEGETEVLDSSLAFLLSQILVAAKLLVNLFVAALLGDGVQQIIVEVIHPAPLELLLEDSRNVLFAVDCKRRHLVCKQPGVSRIFLESVAYYAFAFSSVVNVCGVVVVDAVSVCIVHQFFCLRYIYRSGSAFSDSRESHASKTEHGNHFSVLVVYPFVNRGDVSVQGLGLEVGQERVVLEGNGAGRQCGCSQAHKFQSLSSADVFVVFHGGCDVGAYLLQFSKKINRGGWLQAFPPRHSFP